MSEVGTNDGFAVVTPATVAYVNVIVPPTKPVTVGDTTAAPIEPVEVIEKPQRQLVFPAITGSVALAVPAAAFPPEAEMEMRSADISGARNGVPCWQNAGEATMANINAEARPKRAM